MHARNVLSRLLWVALGDGPGAVRDDHDGGERGDGVAIVRFYRPSGRNPWNVVGAALLIIILLVGRTRRQDEGSEEGGA